jgi:hypothetical protein
MQMIRKSWSLVVAVVLVVGVSSVAQAETSVELRLVNESGRVLSLQSDHTMVNGGLGWSAGFSPPELLEPNTTTVVKAATSTNFISATVSYQDATELRRPIGFTRSDFIFTAAVNIQEGLWVPEAGMPNVWSTTDTNGSFLTIIPSAQTTANGGVVTAVIRRTHYRPPSDGGPHVSRLPLR